LNKILIVLLWRRLKVIAAAKIAPGGIFAWKNRKIINLRHRKCGAVPIAPITPEPEAMQVAFIGIFKF